MEPRPAHSGGSASANAVAERAARISARGTSVCARRSIIFGKPGLAAVWQIGKSGSTSGGISPALAPASARIKAFPASSVSSPAQPSAVAPAETNSLWDSANVVMSSSKIGRRKSAESQIQRLASSRHKPQIGVYFDALSGVVARQLGGSKTTK